MRLPTSIQQHQESPQVKSMVLKYVSNDQKIVRNCLDWAKCFADMDKC